VQDTVGFLVSRLTTAETLPVPPPEVAWQVNVVPTVSAITVAGPHPVWDATGDSRSWTSQFTETLDLQEPHRREEVFRA
jgi:hypothetical protein